MYLSRMASYLLPLISSPFLGDSRQYNVVVERGAIQYIINTNYAIPFSKRSGFLYGKHQRT